MNILQRYETDRYILLDNELQLSVIEHGLFAYGQIPTVQL